MDPAFMFEDLDPANQFIMEGLNMAFAAELVHDAKPLPNLSGHNDRKNSNISHPPKTSTIGTYTSS